MRVNGERFFFSSLQDSVFLAACLSKQKPLSVLCFPFPLLLLTAFNCAAFNLQEIEQHINYEAVVRF